MTDSGRSGLTGLPGTVCVLFALVSVSCAPPEKSIPTAASAKASAPVRLDRKARAARHVQLEPGGLHRYEIALEAGEYLALEADQQGVDLVVDFHDPAGRRVLRVDNWSGADGSRGPEVVHWIAETAGIHLAEIGGWARTKSGDYTLAIRELHPATDRDRERVDAERALSDGDALVGKGQTRQAVGEYERALAELRGLGDLPRQADTLFRLGKARKELGEGDEAVTLYDGALRLYKAVGNERQQAYTLHARTHARCSPEALAPCLADLESALPLWERAGDLRGQAMTLNDLGVTYRMLGETSAARACYDRALEIYEEIGGREKRAQTLRNRGRLLALLGLRLRAVEDLLESLETSRGLEEVRALDTLGLIHLGQDRPEEARSRFRQALERAGPERVRAAGSSEARGWDRAYAISLAGWGRCQADLADDGEGLARLQEALGLFRTLGDRAWQAWTLGSLGRAWSDSGDPHRARSSFEEALELFRILHDRSGVAEMLRLMAELERRDTPSEARRLIEEALGLLEDVRSRATANPELDTTLAAEQSYYDLHVDLLMDLDEREPSTGHDAEALGASERARARSLLEILSWRTVPPAREAGPRPGTRETKLLEMERDLKRRINVWELELRSGSPEAPLSRERAARIEEEQRDLLLRYESVRERLRALSPRHAALTGTGTLTAAEIRRFVDDETLLLEYKLGDDRSYLWAVTATSFESFRLPPRRQVEEKARQVHELVVENRRQARRRREMALAELSGLLLDPVSHRLGGKKRLVIVADGALHLVPFAALPAPAPADGLLVARHEIVHLPSASVLAELRRQTAGRKPAPGQLAVVADPVFGLDDPRLAAPVSSPSLYRRLDSSREEARALLALVPPAQRFAALDFAANRDVVTGGTVARHRIVHFATHGEIDTEHPELSRLVLSLVDEDGRRRDDGFLDVYDLYDLDLPVELVVLSACRTALGKAVRSEGFVGLTRGFMYAGAPRLIVSLWNVDDPSTAELMARFYRRLLVDKVPPAEALRAAQDSIRSEPGRRDPRHWAGFVLLGDWRDLPRPGEPGRGEKSGRRAKRS